MIQLLNLNTNTSPITAICTACMEARRGEEAAQPRPKSWRYERVRVCFPNNDKVNITLTIPLGFCGISKTSHTFALLAFCILSHNNNEFQERALKTARNIVYSRPNLVEYGATDANVANCEDMDPLVVPFSQKSIKRPSMLMRHGRK